ncbi:M23 family metallopeptidase [Sphingomonas colocasiae]|nr:M23 family metallopeptidase [Sphingomonas colocasiae]
MTIAIGLSVATPAFADEPQKSPDFAHAGSPATGLPAGDSQAFRQRMMDWSAAPATKPVSAPAIAPKVEAPRSRSSDLPRLSSRFGLRNDPLRGGYARHAGVDIPAPLGTPVLASADGEVRYAGSAGGYGNMIEIAHPNGIRTRYAHLSRILVGERAMVRQGQVIALMGSTGRSTGSHLHFEMRANGAAIDPLPHLGDEHVWDDLSKRPALRITPMEPFVSAFARAREANGRAEGDDQGARP